MLNYEIIPGSNARLLVFLHGLMGRGRNFLQVAKKLDAVATSVLIDLPNHGLSAWTNSFDYGDMAKTISEVLMADANLQPYLDKIHVIGHSMGGKTAMQLALQYPNLLRTLTVVDIAPTPSSKSSQFQKLLGALKDLDLDSLKSRAAADLQLQTTITDKATRAFLLQNLTRNDNGAFAWQPNLELLYANLHRIVGFQPHGSAFEKPVLWLKGSNSDYIHDSDYRLMQELFPDLFAVTVADAGHWVHADNQHEFVRLVKEFVVSE